MSAGATGGGDSWFNTINIFPVVNFYSSVEKKL